MNIFHIKYIKIKAASIINLGRLTASPWSLHTQQILHSMHCHGSLVTRIVSSFEYCKQLGCPEKENNLNQFKDAREAIRQNTFCWLYNLRFIGENQFMEIATEKSYGTCNRKELKSL